VRDATAGLCFGFAKRSVRCADFLCSITTAWPSRELSHKEQIVGGGGLARPALGFCATVTPSPSGSVALSGWSHRLSILVGTDERTNEGTFRLRSASCEHRWKRSDDPPLPSLCQCFCSRAFRKHDFVAPRESSQWHVARRIAWMRKCRATRDMKGVDPLTVIDQKLADP
jgi:hypothetical protein